MADVAAGVAVFGAPKRLVVPAAPSAVFAKRLGVAAPEGAGESVFEALRLPKLNALPFAGSAGFSAGLSAGFSAGLAPRLPKLKPPVAGAAGAAAAGFSAGLSAGFSVVALDDAGVAKLKPPALGVSAGLSAGLAPPILLNEKGVDFGASEACDAAPPKRLVEEGVDDWAGLAGGFCCSAGLEPKRLPPNRLPAGGVADFGGSVDALAAGLAPKENSELAAGGAPAGVVVGMVGGALKRGAGVAGGFADGAAGSAGLLPNRLEDGGAPEGVVVALGCDDWPNPPNRGFAAGVEVPAAGVVDGAVPPKLKPPVAGAAGAFGAGVKGFAACGCWPNESAPVVPAGGVAFEAPKKLPPGAGVEEAGVVDVLPKTPAADGAGLDPNRLAPEDCDGAALLPNRDVDEVWAGAGEPNRELPDGVGAAPKGDDEAGCDAAAAVISACGAAMTVQLTSRAKGEGAGFISV